MKPLNLYPQMADALKIISVEPWPQARVPTDEHVARAHTVRELAVEQNAIDQAAQTEGDGDQTDRNQNDTARNVLGVHQIERAGKQQPGCQASLHA